jgi:flagellar basal body-associated protein FliL
MSAGTIILIVVVLLLVAAAAAVVTMLISRRSTGRVMHGPEYDRLADEVGPRKAQAEFAKRRQRVDGLGVKSLSDERRAAYTGQWEVAQQQFIDNPVQSVRAAAAMIAAVTADLGYDVTDHDQLLKDLSVYHGRYLDGYRSARKAAGRAGQATTEALRRALLSYRVLFFDLLESPGSATQTRDAGQEPDGAQAAPAPVPAQRPWQQVTQGRHWKTRRQDDADSVTSTRL